MTGEEFSFSEAVGGIRGLVEAMAPGVIFVGAFVAGASLTLSLVASSVVAVVAVVVRLVQRTPVMQALSGMLGIAIGVIWAWHSGQAQNFFAWGLLTNAVYLVGVLISIALRAPAVGLVVESIRISLAAEHRAQAHTEGENVEPETDTSPLKGLLAWRQDRQLVRRYTVASLLWVGMFTVRLAVQLPLFVANDVGWLGGARLVMGVPLWAVVLYLTWMVVRKAHPPALQSPSSSD